jgi:hypothetical protein
MNLKFGKISKFLFSSGRIRVLLVVLLGGKNAKGEPEDLFEESSWEGNNSLRVNSKDFLVFRPMLGRGEKPLDFFIPHHLIGRVVSNLRGVLTWFDEKPAVFRVERGEWDVSSECVDLSVSIQTTRKGFPLTMIPAVSLVNDVPTRTVEFWFGRDSKVALTRDEISDLIDGVSRVDVVTLGAVTLGTAVSLSTVGEVSRVEGETRSSIEAILDGSRTMKVIAMNSQELRDFASETFEGFDMEIYKGNLGAAKDDIIRSLVSEEKEEKRKLKQ